MKKMDWKPVLLVVFAVIAVYVAAMPNGVAVYDLAQSREPFYCTYFNLLEDVNFGISMPIAALGACVNLMSAGIYLARKKTNLLSFMKLISIVSAIMAVVPILVKDPVLTLVPNMLLPMALLADYVVAYDLEKKTAAPEPVELKGKPKNKRKK